jgi:hypothetical protein
MPLKSSIEILINHTIQHTTYNAKLFNGMGLNTREQEESKEREDPNDPRLSEITRETLPCKDLFGMCLLGNVEEIGSISRWK